MRKRFPDSLSDEALEVLLAYDYPGNVRELENLIDRAVILTAGDTIFPEVLPVRPSNGWSPDLMSNLSELTLAEALSRLEKTYLDRIGNCIFPIPEVPVTQGYKRRV